jgi:hypothetical protein
MALSSMLREALRLAPKGESLAFTATVDRGEERIIRSVGEFASEF